MVNSVRRSPQVCTSVTTTSLRHSAPAGWRSLPRRRAAVPDRDDGRRGSSGERDHELGGCVEKMTIASGIHPGTDEIIIPLGVAREF